MEFYSLEADVVFGAHASGSLVTRDWEIGSTGKRGSLVVELFLESKKRAEALDWIDEYRTSHSHDFVVIGGLGHREPAALTAPCLTSASVFCRATRSERVRASFSNALHCAIREGPAIEML